MSLRDSFEKKWGPWYYSHFSQVINNRPLNTDNMWFQWKIENGWIAIAMWLYCTSLNNLKLGFVRIHLYGKFPFQNRKYEIKPKTAK